MSYFSFFWKKEYPEIGVCCVFQPFEDRVSGGRTWLNYIDIMWMKQQKLKWVGWDRQYYFIWIRSDGTVFRFSDLPRTELGKQYEKNIEKLEIPMDGTRPAEGPLSGEIDLEWEAMVQRNCGLCKEERAGGGGGDKPDSAGVSGPGGGSELPSSSGTGPGGNPGSQPVDTSLPSTNSAPVTDYAAVTDTSLPTGTLPGGTNKNERQRVDLAKIDPIYDYSPTRPTEQAPDNIPLPPYAQPKVTNTEAVRRKAVTSTKPTDASSVTNKIPTAGKHTPTLPPVEARREQFADLTRDNLPKVDNTVNPYIPEIKANHKFDMAQQQKEDIRKMTEKFAGLRPTPQTLAETTNYQQQRPPKRGFQAPLERPKARMAAFFFKHPIIAQEIGGTDESLNISSVASRFATLTDDPKNFRWGYLGENAVDDQGKILRAPNPFSNKGNAFRHTLWQAIIASRYGQAIAHEVADAHEEDPSNYWMGPFQGSKNERLKNADEPIDLWNNITGRDIGGKNSGKTMKELAIVVLNKFLDQGLYTLSDDGRMQLTKLTRTEYEQMRAAIEKRNEFAMTQNQYERYLKDLQARINSGMSPREWEKHKHHK